MRGADEEECCEKAPSRPVAHQSCGCHRQGSRVARALGNGCRPGLIGCVLAVVADEATIRVSVLALVRPQRVLVVTTGSDGELMVPFRNFVAWLAVHGRPSRERLTFEEEALRVSEVSASCCMRCDRGAGRVADLWTGA